MSAPPPLPLPGVVGSAERPRLRPVAVAVVGAGPAGFYTVEALLKLEARGVIAEVDLFERLPSPYGLVRYGVAPDHQKIKSVTAAYEKIAGHPRVRFLGNVHVGHDALSVEELARHYDQVVFAVGCETDRLLGIPGEDLSGSHAATRFVAWYNGHPDFREYSVNLDAERAVIVGAGDVALDLARLLLRDPETLATTDIAGHALRVFRRSRVREVVILARRGPAQAAFATKELEDIVDLPDLRVSLDASLVADALSRADDQDRLAKRKLDYLAKLATRESSRTSANKQLKFSFLTSPVRILGEEGRVRGVEVEHNEIVFDAAGGAAARGTGRLESIDAGLVFRSVGYRGVPIPGLPFDDRKGLVPNRDGRVLGGDALGNVYVSGWIKRGPSGVIGTNKTDASATVALMAEDLAGRAAEPGRNARNAIDSLLSDRRVRVVTWHDWKRLDRFELELGKKGGRVRDKFSSVEEALRALEEIASPPGLSDTSMPKR